MHSQSSSCHVMAKPSSSICNLDCDYCFYLEKEKLYPEKNKQWRMSSETLEAYVKQYIEAQSGNDVHFAWQGGEPTLMGVGFFEEVVAYCKQYAGNKTIHHAFQTNGILIDDEWCVFLKNNHFLVGISIDGDEELHDVYRVNRAGKPTFNKVLDAIALLKKHHIEFNTMTVIHDLNAQHPQRVYRFLKSIGSRYMQFIPLVERQLNDPSTEQLLTLVLPGESRASVTPWTVPAIDYGTFLSGVFDIWVTEDVGKVYVNMFDSTLATWCGYPSGSCITSETCGHAFALEANGDLYQCDHYVYPEYKLGNIHQETIQALNQHPNAIQFGVDKKQSLTKDCVKCDYRFACHGGCPKHRFDVSPSGAHGHNYLCSGYKQFFTHTAPYMKIMSDLVRQQKPCANIMVLLKDNPKFIYQYSNQTKNALCACGSGNKVKRCCGVVE